MSKNKICYLGRGELTHRDKVSCIVPFFGNEVIHICGKLVLEILGRCVEKRSFKLVTQDTASPSSPLK